MIRNTLIATLWAAGMAMSVSPAHANGWAYTGPHGATVTHWGAGPHYWGPGPCCYGRGVVAGTVAGIAVGTAVGIAAARPTYVVPPPVVYAPAPAYPPGYYYYP